MFTGVNEIAVLVTALLGIAVGSIWYSPLLFGEYWMRAVGLSVNDLAELKNKIVSSIVYAGLANLALFFVLAHLILITRASGRSVITVGFLLMVLLTALTASAVIWEKRPVAYLLIHAGYASVLIFGGLTVLSYWSW